ncbi:recombinase family protein [Oscillospiraceae bacterium OttesenSCG-928-F05]|nr:recombinase family protein [Oscillospiraceae bacterium OttesenSCG-928-F05]
MKMQDNYDVGIYCRLSRDDSNGTLESMSIANQRQMLIDFVEEKGWKLHECYIDDGFTGTNFDRPDFKRMIRDAEAGRIDCIVTKDLSRLGRNYVQTGYYTEEYFVERGIRFIAINDSIDTMQENNDIAAFHHVLNEFYPKQVSKKVRQVKKAGAAQGKFMNSQAPYGYQKSPEDKHKLVIDEDAARIVRRLFTEFAGGDSARLIADRLNAEKVDSPRFYHYAKLGRSNPLSEQKNVWGSATVLQLLRNQAYLGHMVQGKREVVSFKTKKMRRIPPEDWIIVENTHEPIIARELWDMAHSHMKTSSRVQKTKHNTLGLFAGILRCADCGSPLAFMHKQLKSGEKGVYRCSRYNNNGGGACTTHYIEEAVISEFVLQDIRLHASLAQGQKEQIANRLMLTMKDMRKGELSALRGKVREGENRLSAITAALKNLYDDKCAGKVPEAVFASLMAEYAAEQSTIEERLPGLRKQLVSAQEASSGIDEWLTLVGQYTELETLDRATVARLIESITVSERTKKYGRQTQELEIEYRFIGNLLDKTKEDIA